jgi:hypothetical protein
MCLPPPPYAVPCPPGKHCVENLLERTAACGDGCRRRPPHPLLNVARVVLEVFSRLGRRLRCVVQPPPSPLGRRSPRDRVIQPSPPAASDVAARLRAAGAGPPGARPPRPRLPRGRPQPPRHVLSACGSGGPTRNLAACRRRDTPFSTTPPCSSPRRQHQTPSAAAARGRLAPVWAGGKLSDVEHKRVGQDRSA